MCGSLKSAGLGDGPSHWRPSAIGATDQSTIPKRGAFEAATRVPGPLHTPRRLPVGLPLSSPQALTTMERVGTGAACQRLWWEDQGREMTFSYRLDKADYLAFHRYRIAGMYLRGGSRVWSLRGFALLTFALALVEWHSGRPSAAAGLVMGGGATLLFPRVYWGLVVGRFRRIVNDPQNAHLLGHKTLTLTPEGLHIADAGGEGYLGWRNIVRAARTEDHIFLFFSIAQAVVIPRASLEGVSFEAVWTTAITYLDEHRGRGTRQGLEGTGPATIQGSPALVFSYRLDESDWTALGIHHRRSKVQDRHRWLVRFAVLPIPLFLVILGMVRPPVNWDLVVLLMGLSVLCFLFYPRVLDKAALRQVEHIAGNSANAHCLGERRIALSPEWLHVQGSGVQSTIAWPSIVKAERTDDHIFIYVSTVEALIIPRVALTGASFDDVWTRVNEYLDHSRGVGST